MRPFTQDNSSRDYIYSLDTLSFFYQGNKKIHRFGSKGGILNVGVSFDHLEIGRKVSFQLGYKGGVRGYFMDDLALHVTVSDDDFFDTTVQFGVTLFDSPQHGRLDLSGQLD